MATIKFTTYNVKGLNTSKKRFDIFNELKLLGPDVVFLQETHISLQSRLRLFSKEYPVWFQGDTISSRSRGVAIGFTKKTRFVLEERLVDPEGRYLFLRGRLNEEEYTLANIYAPNKNPMKYLANILGEIMEFMRGHLILMGDFNFCLNPSIDSTARSQGKICAHLKEIKQKLSNWQFVDIWRVQHPTKRDYTFYSPVHGSHSRIDWGIVEHRVIDKVSGSMIGNITYSDHAPMTIEMSTGRGQAERGQWRLNEELIRQVEGVNRFRQELENFFEVNDTGDVSGATLWEAHKAYIRGVLIEMGARKKKDRREKNPKING